MSQNNNCKSQDMPLEFLPFKAVPKDGDKLLVSRVYLFPLNVVERGLFTGIKLIQKTIAADSASGRLTAYPGDIKTIRYVPDSYFEIKLLPVTMTERSARAMAEACAVPDEAKGWRRSFRTSSLLFRHDEFKTVGHIYLLRGGKLIDTFTAHCGDAAALIELMLGEADGEAGSAQL